MDELVRLAGQTSSFLKYRPFPILKDLSFTLYIVAASESDEGLVLLQDVFLVILQLPPFLSCNKTFMKNVVHIIWGLQHSDIRF